MKIIDNFLVLARFAALMSLLIISRLVSPTLTDSALSEGEYTEGDPAKAADDAAAARETPVVYASLRVVSSTEADAFGQGSRSPQAALSQPAQ